MAARLHWDGLVFSVRGVVILLGWLLPTLAVGLRPGKPFRWLAAQVIVVAGYAGIWIMLSPEMDYFFRFQYALVPIVASSWCAVWTDVWGDLDRSARVPPSPIRRVLTVMIIGAVIGGLVWQHRRFVPVSTETGLLDAARLLRRHGSPANAIVTTEAGLLPLYSEWRAIDAWGLNDARIVWEGGITNAYLAEIRPDVIVFHSYYTPFNRSPQADGDWNGMVVTLHRYAPCHGYELAGVFAGGLEESHYYFVDPKWPASGAFSSELKALRYGWWGTTQAVPELSALEHHTFKCD
ncbi:MAG: hypothetical protein EXQ55_05605 [Acidobacteria bacterium]|nr:hypothetical protein [Acidobacteriota bacterium]